LFAQFVEVGSFALVGVLHKLNIMNRNRSDYQNRGNWS
jgi:hypothetical protein